MCRYKGEWHISHGLCIYDKKLFDVLSQLKLYSSVVNERIVFQLYLDKNFFVGQKEEDFIRLVGDVKRNYCYPKLIMHTAWIEGTNKFPHKTGYNLSIEERYWTKDWAEKLAKQWWEKLPLPKRHAEKYNELYRRGCKSDYLMLDFYEN